MRQAKKSVSFASVDNLNPTMSSNYFVSVANTEEGRRKENEDVCIIIDHLNEELKLVGYPPQALYGIYDGHSGILAANYVAKHLPKMLCYHPSFQSNPHQAFVDVYKELDKKFLELAKIQKSKSGTTALTVLIRDNKLFIANTGDCRAVLCRNKKAINLSSDHRPNRQDEINRIEKAGGWIERAEVLNIPRLYRLHLDSSEVVEETEDLVGWVEVSRVNGALGITRSIGDILIKDWKEQHFKKEFKGNLIIPDPEITEEIIKAQTDEFLIIASDGLWDVFDSQSAVTFILSSLLRKKSPDEISEELVEMAYELGSLDNITVIILFFYQNY